MPGNSKTLRLREMFRFRSMQRHQEMRESQAIGSVEIRESNAGSIPSQAPPNVPIVCVQCDPSFDAEDESFERDLYRVRSFKRTSKGLISLGDSFRSRNTSNCSHPHHSPRSSVVSAVTPVGRHSKLSESYIHPPSAISLRQERHSTVCEPTSTKSGGRNLFSDYHPNSPSGTLRPPSTCSLSNIAAPVKVQILGGPTVGKTMLCRQFLTAEFMGGKTESWNRISIETSSSPSLTTFTPLPPNSVLQDRRRPPSFGKISEDSVERFVVIEVDGWNRSLMLIDNIREEAAEETNSTEEGLSFFAPPPSSQSAPIQRQRAVSAVTPTVNLDEQTEIKPRKSSFTNFRPDAIVHDRKMQPEFEMRILDVDIYVVVYAVDEEASFKVAKSIFKQIQEIRRSDGKLRLFYLVGNKTDLVRSRQVTTQRGRKFAAANGATFFEVSAAINHLVDELLVDMVVKWRKEIAHHEFTRLGLPMHDHVEGAGPSSSASDSRGRQSWTSTLTNPKNMLQRIFKQQFSAKSCMELQKS